VPSTAYKRLFLRAVYRTVSETVSLLDALNTLADARFTDTKSGRVVVGTSSSGHSVEFAAPGAGTLSPESLAELVSDLLDRYDAALVELGGTPTDAQIYATMLGRLTRITSFRTLAVNLRKV